MTEDAAAPAGAGEFTVMGVINVTPDSFSDGGRYLERAAAVDQGLRLLSEGASILDVGGESTRPGAAPVTASVELERVLPVIEGLRSARADATISIDTSKAEVARAAIDAGAAIVNDVTGLRGDSKMAEVIAGGEVAVCLMHMLGEPRTMQDNPRYEDVVDEVRAFLEARLAFAIEHGIAEERILLDPGIGFGKTAMHNLELLRRLEEIVALGRPVVIGTSRKSFLGHLTGRDVGDRVPGTIATNVIAYLKGASVFRVHDVSAVSDALQVAAATFKSWPETRKTSRTLARTTRRRATPSRR
jgi:dihydropteroate synthase